MEGLIFGGAYLRSEICVSNSIGLASVIVGSKFTVFAHCFTLYLRAIFQVQAPRCLYLEGRFNGGFLRYRFGGLIFGGAYFRNFTVDCFRGLALAWQRLVN